MDETAARKTCWVAAINSVEPARALLPGRLPEAEDGQLAEQFDKLAAKHSSLSAYDRHLKCPAWLPAALPIIGFVFGITADAFSSSGRINLIAFPIFAVLAWNFAMYLFAFARSIMPDEVDTGAHGLGNWLATKYEAIVSPLSVLTNRSDKEGPSWSDVRREFLGYWFNQQRPILMERIKVNLHIAAITAAIGLVAGMYLRGLAFEYRAGWSSTFLDAESLESLLRFTLSPAAWVTGIPLPDAAHLKLLSWSTGSKGENAAMWIHLYAATCILFIGFPRLVLAYSSASKVANWQRNFPLNLNAIGLASGPGQPLEDASNPKARHICVVPFNLELEPKDREIVRLFAFGEAGGPVNLEYRDKVDYADIDEYFAAFKVSEPEPFRHILLFNLATTPEHEVQGDAVKAMQQRTTKDRLLVYLDAESFVLRFGEDSDFEERMFKRQENWTKFLQTYGLKPVFLRAKT